jgi:hypothetical protein
MSEDEIKKKIKKHWKKSKSTCVNLTNSWLRIILEERKGKKRRSSRLNNLMSKNKIKKITKFKSG